jgi:hypothetical protein
MRELFFFQVKYVDAAFCSYPNVRAVEPCNAVYEIIAKGGGIVLPILEVPELVTVKPADAVLGTKPHISLVVLGNGPHGTGGQPFCNRIIPEKYLLPAGVAA